MILRDGEYISESKGEKGEESEDEEEEVEKTREGELLMITWPSIEVYGGKSKRKHFPH